MGIAMKSTVLHQEMVPGQDVHLSLSWTEQREDLSHKPANNSQPMISFAKIVQKLDLLICQLPWIGHKKIAILPQQYSVSMVWKVTDAANRLQNPVSNESEIVKYTELVPYRRPHGLRDVTIERRAICNHYLRLDPKLIEMQKKLEQLLLVGASAKTNRKSPVIQRVCGNENHESVIKLVQGQHSRKTLHRPGLVVFDQVNFVGSVVEPAVASGEGRTDMKVSVKPFIQAAEGSFICTNGNTSFLNRFTAILLPGLNEIRLESKELVAGATAINTDPNLDSAGGV